MSESHSGRRHTPAMLRIPPPVWAVLFLAVAFAADVMFAPPRYLRYSSHAAGVVVFLTGLAWGASCVRLFWVNKTAIEPASETNAALITNGPYRVSRNPMYLGLIFMTLGIAIYIGTLSFFVVPVLLFLLCNSFFIPFEEEKMARQFGKVFDAYRARVRRWI